jgi:hypothetical protein
MAEGKFSGGAAAGFGQVSWDTGGTAGPGAPADGSAYNVQMESNLIYSGKNENMDYYFRMRARGTSGDTEVKDFTEGTFTDTQGTGQFGALNTVRVRVGYNAGAFRVAMGKLPGIGGIGFADLRPLRAPGGFRHYVDNLGMFDSAAIQLEFNAGPAKVGLAISTDCQVQCDAGTGVVTESGGIEIDPATDTITETTGSAKLRGTNTIMPYVQAAFGAIKVGARFASSSAKLNAALTETPYVAGVAGASTTTTVDGVTTKGSGMVVEVAFNSDAFGAALEYTSTTAKCETTLDPGCKDKKVSGPGLAVTFAGGGLVQYSSSETDTGGTGKKPSTQLISGSFLFDVGGGKLGPEVASATTNAGGTAKDQKGTLIRLIATTGF